MFAKTLAVTLTLTIGLLSASAQAAFVHTDWKTGGDQLATLDTETGIEWLKLTNTDMKSINTVLSEINTTYSGWRLPSESEVRKLLTNVWTGLNVDIDHVIERSGAYTPGANLFAAMFSNGIRNITHHFGMYVADDGVVRMAGSYLNENGGYTAAFGMNFYITQTMDSTQPKWYATNTHGVFLVSDGGVTLSSVNDPTLNINNPNAPINNEPSDVPALGFFSALLGAFALRRRRPE